MDMSAFLKVTSRRAGDMATEARFKMAEHIRMLRAEIARENAEEVERIWAKRTWYLGPWTREGAKRRATSPSFAGGGDEGMWGWVYKERGWTNEEVKLFRLAEALKELDAFIVSMSGHGEHEVLMPQRIAYMISETRR